MTEKLPRQQARTRRYHPRRATRVRGLPGRGPGHVLRSKSGTDPLTCLWLFDVGAGTERLIADSAVLSFFRRRGSAAGGEEAPGAGPRAATGGHRVVRPPDRGVADGPFQPGGAGSSRWDLVAAAAGGDGTEGTAGVRAEALVPRGPLGPGLAGWRRYAN